MRGVHFAVWAPNARARQRCWGLQSLGRAREPDAVVRGGSGVWEIFLPGLAEGVGLQI